MRTRSNVWAVHARKSKCREWDDHIGCKKLFQLAGYGIEPGADVIMSAAAQRSILVGGGGAGGEVL